MKKSTRRSRRHRNPQTNEETKKPFFSKANDTSIQTKSEQPFFQTKLTVGQPGDKYEQEADAVADAVVNKSNNTPTIQQKKISSIQRYMTNAKEDELGTNTQRIEKDKMIQEKPIQRMGGEEEEPVQMMEEEEESLQAKEEEEPVQMMEEEEESLQAKEEEEPVQMMEEEESLQAKSNSTNNNSASPQVAKQLKQSKGGGAALPKTTQAEMENSFGVDFSGVKIHTNDKAVQMNKDLGAQAFTHGKDIYFNEGKFNPTTKEGKKLLAHELTHVIQQKGGSGNLINRLCGDEAADWYNPFVRVASYDPSCTIQYVNVDKGSKEYFSTDWKRNAVDTGILSAVGAIGTAVIAKRLGLDKLAILVGGLSAFARGYVGLTVKERIRGYKVNRHTWHGRYKYNVITGNLLAVDFHGTGKDVQSLVAPWYYEQAIFNGDGEMIGSVWSNTMHMPGVSLGGDHLPERSFGTI